ncbi:MAG: phage tail tape measure protein, partial [Synergistaceae bacterium]|nr:phage tail tape measure protein [Candidatus Equadaptatus faecalis]
MNVLDLFATISLDSSGFHAGLGAAMNTAKNLGGGIANALGNAAKLGAAALAATTAAATAFAASSVAVGKEFDAAMSGVAATAGKTVDELNNEMVSTQLASGEFSGSLRDLAKQLGSETSFSATQAAEALNYMALAGYNAQQSADMLPTVLNLAAAGDMELATASDMVTDAQSALGLSLDETKNMVDQMAMASSKSNTSVAQLGEAFLTVGGTAKNLSGGTTELSTALGILANSGIKGAEGGTALRNVILSLSAPTDKAAEALNALGVNAFDAEGNMRPLDDVFTDLNNSLEPLTQQEKTQALNNIFNKVDLKSVEALMAGTEAWDDLAASIDNAAGAAGEMAETKMDNLAGDITKWQSALEGAQIAISDYLTPSIREFVQFGTEGLSQLTEAINKGDINSVVESFGTILSDGVNKIIEATPMLIDAGMRIMGALGKGLLDNMPTIIKAAIQVISMFTKGIMQATPELGAAGLEIIIMLGEYLIENLPEIVKTGFDFIAMLVTGIAEAIPELIPVAIEVISQLAQNLLQNIDILFNAALQLALALALGFAENIDKIIEIAPMIMNEIGKAIINNLPMIITVGLQIIIALAEGIIKGSASLLAAIIETIANIIVLFRDTNWKEIGIQILEGLKTGVLEAAVRLINTIVDIAKRV